MIALLVGLGNLCIGAAYAGLGLLSAWETFSLRRYRGWSRFGLGFSLMAASCGPHHLAHGWEALSAGDANWPALAATLIGLPGGLIFVWLRLEATLLFEGKTLPHGEALATEISGDILAFLRTESLAQIQGVAGLEHLRQDLNERAAIRSEGKVRELIIRSLVAQ